MNMLHKTGFILSLALCFALPIKAGAVDTAPVASANVEPADAPPMSSMQDLMRDMRRGQGPEKCRMMKSAAIDAKADDAMPGMQGMAGMQGEKCRQGGAGKPACKQENCMQGQGKPCMKGGHPNCRMGDDSDDQRLENLEKRMDMMQIMLEMMLRNSGGNR
jgi:hypothetical protein